jgi:hypothetical protein
MSLRVSSSILAAGAVLAALSLSTGDARACGGCFHEPPKNVNQGSQSTVVTGHRMALSVSLDRTILWDQIQYAGDPQGFAWVLPVRPGATLSLANDALFEALDAATATTIASPRITCPGVDEYGPGPVSRGGCSFGCGAAAEAYGGAGGGTGNGSVHGGDPPDPVTVVHQASVGPYETVTIHSAVPGALYDWLKSHGYAVDAAISPIIDAYEKEGFDFIALRLTPGEGVREMQPVRVTSPGAAPVLPLRMVAAGTGANVAITLFVIGEGRWETKNFPGVEITDQDLSWDFKAVTSDYSTVRQTKLAASDGRTWLTTYALHDALFGVVPGVSGYKAQDGYNASSIWELYMHQGVADGVQVDPSCPYQNKLTLAPGVQVVDGCGQGGGGSGGSGSTGSGMAGAGGAAGGGMGGMAGSGGAGMAGGGMAGSGAGGMAGSGAGGMAGGGMAGSGAGGMAGSGAGGMAGSGAGGMAGSGAGGGMGGSGGDTSSGTGTSSVCGPDQIDAKDLACGSLDDLAVALVGMHPTDVWVTRLESNLPRAALSADLELQAQIGQTPVSPSHTATHVVNPPCADWTYTNDSSPYPMVMGPGDKAPPRGGPPSRGSRQDRVLLGIALASVAAALGRRLSRGRLRGARASAAS